MTIELEESNLDDLIDKVEPNWEDSITFRKFRKMYRSSFGLTKKEDEALFGALATE